MKNRRHDYVSYLLRLWWTGSEEDGVWLASLTNPLTEERLGFPSLDELFAFLLTQVDDQKRQAPEEEEEEEDRSRFGVCGF